MSTVSEPTLVVSPAALGRIRELSRENANPAARLRISVEGGGCSGFRYDFRFDDAQAQDDVVLDRDGVAVLVDRLSMAYLGGAELDYVEQLAGARFVIRNPNAKGTCGCGSSFTA